MENMENAPVMSVKDWVITILITIIPGVGIIMLFVWAFGSGENPNKSNWAKAQLVWFVIGIVLTVLFMLVFGAALFAALSGGGY